MVKCNDKSCCTEVRSSLRHVLPNGFLPTPFPILQGPNGLTIPKPNEHDGKRFASFLLQQSLALTPSDDRFHELPYDLYCPSLQLKPELLLDRTCKECGLYFCSKKAVAAHKTSLHKKKKKTGDRVSEEENERAESEDMEDLDTHDLETHSQQDEAPAFVSVEKSNENPWVDDE